MLRYEVDDGSSLVMPDVVVPKRADKLWRTTCFELFLRFDDEEHYIELNFSPSECWAAYAFSGYREGMTVLPVEAPIITRIIGGVEVNCFPGALPHGNLAMALTAVIEEEGGRKSYWSLAHPPGPPDFHHAACFAARLPAPEAP